jgi:hypothetical protein
MSSWTCCYPNWKQNGPQHSTIKSKYDFKNLRNYRCYCYEMVSHKATHALWPFLNYCASHSNHSRKLLAETSSREAGETWREMVKFYLQYSSFIFVSFLTCPKILRHGTDCFTSPPKEVVLRISITLKNTASSARFEPLNLGPNGKNSW